MLDTSTVILLPRLVDPSALPAESVIAAITLAELSVGPLLAPTEEQRSIRQAHVEQAETDFELLPFDAAAARAFGRVAASLRSAGRKPFLSDRLRGPDLYLDAVRGGVSRFDVAA